MDKHLHIIALDIPYPPDYGGVFEMFYKLKYLQKLGVKIHLHCFEHRRSRQPILTHYCETVHYYKRKTGHAGFSLQYPYIVSSRSNEQLAEILSKDDHPVLMEGVHSTWLLHQGRLANRRTVLRTHNVESDYYRSLSKYTSSPFKKIYFGFESFLLDRYEKEAAQQAALVLCISQKDVQAYKERLGVNSAAYLPSFIGWDYPYCEKGSGTYCLYHGNLSVPENEKAALWLITQVFRQLDIPLIVAGKNPGQRLHHQVSLHPHIHLVENPSENDMQDLIRKAHINILPSFSTTGVKFKLLNSVFVGRHCLVNPPMLEGTTVAAACNIAVNAEDFRNQVMLLMDSPFTVSEIDRRDYLLKKDYNNLKHAGDLVQWIWG